MASSSHPQARPLQLVEATKKTTSKKEIKARHISREMRDRIAEDFFIVGSAREIARMYRLPISTVYDILHLVHRKQPQSERLSVVDVFERRRA